MTVTFETMSLCFSYFLFSETSFYLPTAPLCKYCTKKNIKIQGWVWDISHLSWCTLCAIHRRTFFGFTKVLVVGMAAPQLLARVVGSKLNEETGIVETQMSKHSHSFSVFMPQKVNLPLSQSVSFQIWSEMFKFPWEQHSWLFIGRDLVYYFQTIHV